MVFIKSNRNFIAVSILLVVLLSGGLILIKEKKHSLKPKNQIGAIIDNHNGVAVYFNGSFSNVSGRNVTADGYNLGLKYQCVEFVKRYYYEHVNHKMPDSYGHARDFFDLQLQDGDFNSRRGLRQHKNPGYSPPRPDDILVFGPSPFNRYGHVAIVTAVEDDKIEIIQQNAYPTREKIRLSKKGNYWMLEDQRILGWLRK